MTDILIQRVLLKHTNRVIWGKNSIKGRSAAAADLVPLKQRKSLHVLVDSNGNYRPRSPDQPPSVASDPAVKGSIIERSDSGLTSPETSSPELTRASTISAPHTPLTTSSLSTSSACLTLRSLPPAFSSPSFYCPSSFASARSAASCSTPPSSGLNPTRARRCPSTSSSTPLAKTCPPPFLDLHHR